MHSNSIIFRGAGRRESVFLDLHTRAAGLMAGTNVFANIAVVGTMALADERRIAWRPATCLIHLGIIAAGSRLPLVCAGVIVVTATMTPRRGESRHLRVLTGLAIIVIVVTASAWTRGGDTVAERFGQTFATDAEGRLDKYWIGAAA